MQINPIKNVPCEERNAEIQDEVTSLKGGNRMRICIEADGTGYCALIDDYCKNVYPDQTKCKRYAVDVI